MEMATFPKPLLASNFFSAASSSLSFIGLKRVRAVLWMRLWFKGLLWLVCSSIQTTKLFCMSPIKLFHFHIICVLFGVALLSSFKNFSFASTTWLTVWGKRQSFQPISAFDVPFSLSLIISSF
uniref:Uncharacterized protein n=1 Tax=Rousettus aegyptiacus TaxID=9407 RepID=A0A7J8FIK0_ROUAE|nr:hypothetical protein HJG63_011984 [Rousettus aegyptiacus]